MKKFVLLSAIATLGLLGLGTGNVQADGGVATNIVTVKITALVQTNDVVKGDTTKFRALKIKFTNKDLLALLEQEFNTNFPDGAKLAQVFGRISVLDKNGDLFLDVSTNANDPSYQLYLDSNGPAVAVGKATSTATKFSDKVTEYQYTYLYYQDGGGDQINFDGMATRKLSINDNATTHKYKATESMSLPGAGYASFDGGNFDAALTGIITGKGKGLPPV